MAQNPRIYTGVCYIVAVDEHFFVPRAERADWCDAPQYAEKFGTLRMASARAEDEKADHPSHHIRPVRVKQTFLLEEI